MQLQVDQAMAADLGQHMLKDGKPVRKSDLPVPSKFRLRLIWVSCVLRLT